MNGFANHLTPIFVGMVFVIFGALPLNADTDDNKSQSFSGSLEETIQLGSRSWLIVDIDGQRVEYGPGDRIHVKWIDGVVYVNDQQVRPLPEREETMHWPVEKIRRIYGTVPMISQYAEDHRGEGPTEEIWNAGMRQWVSLVEDAGRGAMRQYFLLVNGDENKDEPSIEPDEAAEMVAQTLREKTDIVSSVTVERPPTPGSRHRFLRVVWKGKESQKPEGIHLRPQSISGNSGQHSTQLVSKDMFERFYAGQLRTLARDDCEKTFEFDGGNVHIGVRRDRSPKEEEVKE